MMMILSLALSICFLTIFSNADAAITSSSRSLLGGNTACGGTRRRKPWTAFSTQEASLYKEAISIAVSDHEIMRDFVHLHMDSLSEMEAHESCGFVLWHRALVLAFENYLLVPCVTWLASSPSLKFLLSRSVTGLSKANPNHMQRLFD